MFTQLTDMPFHLKDYDTAKKYHDRIVPIRGKGKNAGIRPICDTANGRKKVQYFIRERVTTARAPRAIECVLYETPVVTFVEDGTIILDNTHPSITTSAFMQELLTPFRATVGDKGGNTWVGLGDEHRYRRFWWLPYGERVTFRITEVHPHASKMEPVEPRLIPRWEVNRSAAREVYARFESFVTHCLAISKLIDPQSFFVQHAPDFNYHSRSPQFCFSDIPEPFDPANITEYWAEATTSVIRGAIEFTRSWSPNTGYDMSYTLNTKRIKKNIHDALKAEFHKEIFVRTESEAGVFSMPINAEYIK